MSLPYYWISFSTDNHSIFRFSTITYVEKNESSPKTKKEILEYVKEYLISFFKRNGYSTKNTVTDSYLIFKSSKNKDVKIDNFKVYKDPL